MRIARRAQPMAFTIALLLVVSALAAGTTEAGLGETDHEQPPSAAWWREAVFYEIFVRSFQDSDGDGIGDLKGLISRLDYLNDGDPETDSDLGITGIWLMPIMASPSYHGYDVTDYRTVDKDYGSNQDLEHLIEAAHRRGIRVIIDLVINHTSSRHPWFRDAYRRSSPYHGWYIWAFEGHTYRGPWGQAVWHQLPWWKRGWRHLDCFKYYGLFSPGMPDLDHTSPEVEQEIQSIARFWLEELGVDGFRLDAARHLVEEGMIMQDAPATHAWLSRFSSFVDTVHPGALIVGEIWDETPIIASYGPEEVDLAFHFALARETLDAITQADRTQLVDQLEQSTELLPDGRFASFLTNHDQNRVMWHLDGDPDQARLAAGLLLTGPGVPFLYYGEEIGISGHKPDPDLRTPMQWSAERHAGFSTHRPWRAPKTSYPEINVARQSADPGSLLSTYRRLIRLRQSHPALATGSTRTVDTGSAGVHAVLRQSSEVTILVLANLSSQAADSYRLDLPAGLELSGSVEQLYGPPLDGGSFSLTRSSQAPRLEPKTLYLIRMAPMTGAE